MPLHHSCLTYHFASEYNRSAGEPIWTRWLTWEYFSSCYGWSWTNHKWWSWWRNCWRGIILSFSFKILIWLSNSFCCQANKNHILQVETSIFAMSLKTTPSSLPLELNTSCCELHLVLPLSSNEYTPKPPCSIFNSQNFCRSIPAGAENPSLSRLCYLYVTAWNLCQFP